MRHTSILRRARVQSPCARQKMSGLGRLRIPSSRMAGARVRVGGVAAMILLVAACNHELRPPPIEGGGGGVPGGAVDAGTSIATGAGAAGTGGTAGSGPSRPGLGGTCSDGIFDGCIDSCSSGPGLQVYPESTYCDATGAVVCTDGKVKFSTCAPDSCALTMWTCCNETSGEWMYPPCAADGLQTACPAGSHTFDNQADCIPTSLGVKDCAVLKGAACSGSFPAERSNSRASTTATTCSCLPAGDFPGAGTWQCETYSTLI